MYHIPKVKKKKKGKVSNHFLKFSESVLVLQQLSQDTILSGSSPESQGQQCTRTELHPWLTHSSVFSTGQPFSEHCPSTTFFSHLQLHKCRLINMFATQAHTAFWNH